MDNKIKTGDHSHMNAKYTFELDEKEGDIGLFDATEIQQKNNGRCETTVDRNAGNFAKKNINYHVQFKQKENQ